MVHEVEEKRRFQGDEKVCVTHKSEGREEGRRS